MSTVLNTMLKEEPVLNVLVAGAPNVGKSSLINSLAGKVKARRGNLPGVTRSLQWISLSPRLKLLDSPGLLPPLPDTWSSYYKLVSLNVIPLSSDIPPLNVIVGLGDELRSRCPGCMSGLSDAGRKVLVSRDMISLHESLEAFRRNPNEGIDHLARRFLKELSEGKLGRLCLELPHESDETRESEVA